MRRKRAIIWLVIVFGVLLAASRVAVFSAEERQGQPQDADQADKPAEKTVVALVNGEPVYEEQVREEFEKKWGGPRKRSIQMQSPEVFKQLQRKALDTVIDNELVFQESRKLSIDDIDARVAAKLKELEAKWGAGEGVEKYLKRRSLTVEDYKKAARTRVLVDEYLKQQGIQEPEIPEDEIQRMYKENPKGFTREESVNVTHILIAVDPHAGGEAQEQARQKAEKIRAEILQGKDFAEMAKEHSQCNSSSGGGGLGFVNRGFMPPEFEKVASTADVGAVSEVVKTKFGYHIIKVLERIPAGLVPYEEIRDFIRKYLQQEESKKRLASHVVELRKNAKIEVLLK